MIWTHWQLPYRRSYWVSAFKRSTWSIYIDGSNPNVDIFCKHFPITGPFDKTFDLLFCWTLVNVYFFKLDKQQPTTLLVVEFTAIKACVLYPQVLCLVHCKRWCNWLICWAGALIKWLWEETHVLKVVGSNPAAVYWMDMTFFTLICCLFEKTENKLKRGRGWPIFF